MKQTIRLVFIFIIVHLAGCGVKDEATMLRAFFDNNSSVPITILPYKSGVVMGSDTIKIAPGERIQIGNGSQLGDIKSPIFTIIPPLRLEATDSVKVVFDDSYSVLHFIETPEIITADKYYSFDMSRNVMNKYNYDFEMIRDKNGRINNHYYYFTEEDYEFAKE